MDYYKIRENVDKYTKMMDGYDNSFVINQVEKLLPANSTILELGMGTGIDLISLSKKYKVVGSDYSELFVSDFKLKSELEVLVLDAVFLDIDRSFDCIYSNKVLQHLSVEDFIISLNSQYKHVNNNGLLIHTLWNGEYCEEFDLQLRCVYYNKETLERIIPKEFYIEKVIPYSEFEAEDSIMLVLRKK